MGSISLIAVTHDQADHPALQKDLSQRGRQIALERMKTDPQLAEKLKRLFAE